jgi:hypothetical protein
VNTKESTSLSLARFHAAAGALPPHRRRVVASPLAESKQNYEALGRFITSYAHAEAALHGLARKPTGLSDRAASASRRNSRGVDGIDQSSECIVNGRRSWPTGPGRERPEKGRKRSNCAGRPGALCVPYQQLSRSLLARAAELLVKAQQLEQPEPLLPASKDGRGG